MATTPPKASPGKNSIRIHSAAAQATVEGQGEPASALIDAKIRDLADWRGDTLAHLRKLMHEVVPGVVEEVKWRGVPVWSHAGILCTGETYQQAVKMTFLHGASLPDPHGLFNASLDGNMRRAIDVREGEAIKEVPLKALFRAAAEFDALKAAQKKPRPKAPAASSKPPPSK